MTAWLPVLVFAAVAPPAVLRLLVWLAFRDYAWDDE